MLVGEMNYQRERVKDHDEVCCPKQERQEPSPKLTSQLCPGPCCCSFSLLVKWGLPWSIYSTSVWKSLSHVQLFVTPRTIHGILQARILEWVAFLFSRGSSQPRDRTQVSHIAGRFFTSWATRDWSGLLFPSPGDLPHPGIELGSPALQVDSLPIELSGKPDSRNRFEPIFV